MYFVVDLQNFCNTKLTERLQWRQMFSGQILGLQNHHQISDQGNLDSNVKLQFTILKSNVKLQFIILKSNVKLQFTILKVTLLCNRFLIPWASANCLMRQHASHATRKRTFKISCNSSIVMCGHSMALQIWLFSVQSFFLFPTLCMPTMEALVWQREWAHSP